MMIAAMSGHLDIIKWMTAASIVTGVPGDKIEAVLRFFKHNDNDDDKNDNL